MANSLNFLNKPATPAPAKPILGPQPKPATPKTPFLDAANPWQVGGNTLANKLPPAPKPSTAKPKAQTPARSTPAAQAAPAPARATPRATPQPQATPAAPARSSARPVAQPAPAPVQVVAPRPTPSPAAPWQMAPTAEQAMAMRAAQPAPARSVIPSTGYNYTNAPPPTRSTPTGQPAPWQMAPTAEQAMAQRPMQQAAPPMPTPAAPAGAPTPPPTTPSAPPAQQQPDTFRGPFYGYAPPGPLTIAREYTPQQRQLTPYMTDRPSYTQIGARALLSDSALAVEDARRQRDQAGSFGALQMSGKFRPWSSYSAAEKYYLRYGVMPQGEQTAPPTSGLEAMEASRQQTERLKNEYKETYGRYPRWDNYAYRDPAQQPGAPTAAWAARQGAAPATAPTAQNGRPNTYNALAAPAYNDVRLYELDPQAAEGTAAPEAVNTVAQEILARWRPGISGEGIDTIAAMELLGGSYVPPADRAQQFADDLRWLERWTPAE